MVLGINSEAYEQRNASSKYHHEKEVAETGIKVVDAPNKRKHVNYHAENGSKIDTRELGPDVATYGR